VGELRQIIWVPRDICSLCRSLCGNGKIFPWTLLWVCPRTSKGYDLTLFGSLWTVSQSLLIFFRWTPDIQPGSMPRYILTGLRPYAEFPLLSSLIEGQFLSLISGSNCSNVLVLVSSEAQLIIHKLMAKQKG